MTKIAAKTAPSAASNYASPSEQVLNANQIQWQRLKSKEKAKIQAGLFCFFSSLKARERLLFFSVMWTRRIFFFPQSRAAFLSSPGILAVPSAEHHFQLLPGVQRSTSRQRHSEKSEKENWLHTHKVCSLGVAFEKKKKKKEPKKDCVLLASWYCERRREKMNLHWKRWKVFVFICIRHSDSDPA